MSPVRQISSLVSELVESSLSPASIDFRLKLNAVYNIFGSYQQELLAKYNVECRKGCSECCNHWVEDVYCFESEMIVSYLRENYPEKLERIHQRALEDEELFLTLYEELLGLEGDNFSEYDELKLLTLFRKLNRACPLLENGKCIVYSVRPLTCRTFFSKSSELCHVQRTDEEEGSGTFFVGPGEEVEALLDELHLKYDRNGFTGLRSALVQLLLPPPGN